MNSYRNQALAHNHRDKYQKNIYLQNKKFDAPQTDDELLLVAFCIHKMSQVTSLFFQDEIIKIINILEKIIQENKNKEGMNLITNVSKKSNLLIKISQIHLFIITLQTPY